MAVVAAQEFYVFRLGLVTATNTQILLQAYVVVVIESCSKIVGCLDFEELLLLHH
jgi:hypothetical protein